MTTIDRDSSRKRNVWSAAEKKQILLICSDLEIAGQLLDVCVTLASVSSPILILNLSLLKVQPLLANYVIIGTIWRRTNP